MVKAISGEDDSVWPIEWAEPDLLDGTSCLDNPAQRKVNARLLTWTTRVAGIGSACIEWNRRSACV